MGFAISSDERMMDRLEAMSAFVAVVKAGSFSAAARDLGIPLATLSRRVADLEAELGARLLHRTPRKLSLTDQGHTYYVASAKGGHRARPRGQRRDGSMSPVGFRD